MPVNLAHNKLKLKLTTDLQLRLFLLVTNEHLLTMLQLHLFIYLFVCRSCSSQATTSECVSWTAVVVLVAVLVKLCKMMRKSVVLLCCLPARFCST